MVIVFAASSALGICLVMLKNARVQNCCIEMYPDVLRVRGTVIWEFFGVLRNHFGSWERLLSSLTT